VLASTYPRWGGDHEPGFVHELCKRLVARFDVTVLTPHAPGAARRECLDGVDIRRFRYAPQRLQTLVHGGGMLANLRRARWKWALLPGFMLAQYWSAWRIARELRVDIVHAHWVLPQGLIAYLLRCTGSIPAYALTAHGADLHGLRGAWAQRLKRCVIRDAAALSTVSAALRDEAAALASGGPAAQVIPMGADLRERFVPDAAVPRRHDELLFIGRLVDKKGVACLLDAFKQLRDSRSQLRLRIVGHGPLADRLRARAADLGMSAVVDFVGPLSTAELPALLRAATLLVLPSVRTDGGDQEGVPVVLMEAAGCACPVVASDLPGIRELVGEALAPTMLAAPGNSAALAEVIERFLADPLAALRRAEALRERCMARVDWQPVAAAYAQWLEAALQRPR
jgi:glycosyltransferase involved in cell wall biosynthesis